MTTKILDRTALIISIASSPFVVITIFSLIIIRNFSFSIHEFAIRGGIFLGCTVILPLFAVLAGMLTGRISDFHISIKNQRSIPFVAAVIGSVVLLVLYQHIAVPEELVAMTSALALNGAVFLLVTKYWKISMHSSSFASSVVITGFLVDDRFFCLLLLLLPIIWARLRRRRHDFWQLAVGAILSAVISSSVIFFAAH